MIVSSTVKDIVAGSGIAFEERGECGGYFLSTGARRSSARLIKRFRCEDAGPGDRTGRRNYRSPGAAVADMRGQRRMQHLDGLQPEGFDAVEDPLA